MRLDPITITEYDAHWPALFEEQRRPVESALAPWLTHPVEHIGSTAVPGLPAKPIIDMAAIVTSYESVAEAFPALTAVGWLPAPEPTDRESRRWSWCYPSVEYRTHHLHVVEHASDGWRTWLAFRDHLRVTPEDRDEYARIKRALAAADDRDRPAYRAGKAPFITGVLNRLAD
ncbi:GrpB family protein [Kribbella sp. CA-253562]|uniref:GrpB family protein n=1 Tax=Kribbella sp. CA-253562 TaxID=3239942 RepID=UPI003D930800